MGRIPGSSSREKKRPDQSSQRHRGKIVNKSLPAQWRKPSHHVVDVDGLVLKSDITAENSLTGKAAVGQYIGELIPEGYVSHYYEAIVQAIEEGTGLCSYEIHDRMFMARLTRVSDRRVKVAEHDITDMSMHDVLKLF